MTAVLGNRACGSVKQGGMYAGADMGPGGTYLPCTALVYPHEADSLNDRAPVLIGLDATFGGNYAGAFLAPDNPQPWKNFQKGVGLMDHWGTTYYKEAWVMLNETKEMGPNRRINLDTLKMIAGHLPYPMFMHHGRAIFQPYHTWDHVANVLSREEFGQFEYWTEPIKQGEVSADQVAMWPWRNAESLGRKGDPDFFDHPYCEFLAIVDRLRIANKLRKFMRDAQLAIYPGIVGLTWITKVGYVLCDDEDDVPDNLIEFGVTPALAASDPRAQSL